MQSFLDFEKPVAEIEAKIEELRTLSQSDSKNISKEIEQLEKKSAQKLADLYRKLEPWHKVQVARHGERPHALDYIRELIEDFTPLAGDRCFAEDEAIIGGMGRFRGHSCVIIGQEKGSDTESRLRHNFGMPKPEGYRKAIRLMELADQYNLPVITFVDTAGAYAGVDAEERGQAEAIARSIQACLKLNVPMISTVIGEGGSGGAIAIATGNKVLMLEHSIYSVISPEGCASILWRDANKKIDAASVQKLTAQDLYELKVIDTIIPEPVGGAHRSSHEAINNVSDEVERQLKALKQLSSADLKSQRRQKYIDMGRNFLEA